MYFVPHICYFFISLSQKLMQNSRVEKLKVDRIISCAKNTPHSLNNFINIISAKLYGKFLKDFKLFHYTSCYTASSSSLYENLTLHSLSVLSNAKHIFSMLVMVVVANFSRGREKASHYITLCVFYSDGVREKEAKNIIIQAQKTLPFSALHCVRHFSSDMETQKLFISSFPTIKFNSRNFFCVFFILHTVIVSLCMRSFLFLIVPSEGFCADEGRGRVLEERSK